MQRICQIYLPSFYYSYLHRSLRAITELLEKLKGVGFNGIYLIALWRDGGADNGFDIVEYTVNPKFGTQEDFVDLLKKAYSLGMTVGVDVVPNHVSDKHLLARECLEGTPGYEDCLYIVSEDELNIHRPSRWIFSCGHSPFTLSVTRERVILVCHLLF